MASASCIERACVEHAALLKGRRTEKSVGDLRDGNALALSFARIRSPRLILWLIAGQDKSCWLRASSRFDLSR